jgi:hypothetical protein
VAAGVGLRHGRFELLAQLLTLVGIELVGEQILRRGDEKG